MTRESKLNFCLESAQFIEGLVDAELSKYREELQGLSEDELVTHCEHWDYLWDK